jgi:hypothetical protein
MALESKRHNNPLIINLNLSKAQVGHTHLCCKSPLCPILLYIFAIIGKVTQLLVIKASDFGNIS